MSRLRTANLLGALACEIAERLEDRLRNHPNQTDSSSAALNVIGFYEGCSNRTLSGALKLSHTATVRLVDKLEAAGYVKSAEGSDRRTVALFLTAAGRARARHILQDRCAALGEIVDALTDKQRTQLSKLLEIMLKAVTSSAAEADHICRLCDEIACPAELCPVHLAGLQMSKTEQTTIAGGEK
jgi:MarR family transcriptional regulator, negative regulator of the multidrug operon emrRAB